MVSKDLLKQAKEADKSPGVYIFKNKSGEVIYVGKSISVRERLLSHIVARGGKSQDIVRNAVEVSIIPVLSELESLLVEAQLIKKHLPRYNVSAKDDKHPLYIKITTEEFPKITTSRNDGERKARYFGPFPSSSTVKQVLRQIRHTFPYCSQKRLTKRPCLYSHLGLCAPCPNKINGVSDLDSRLELTKKYKSSIRKILLLLSGKTKRLEKSMLGEMKAAALRQDFEAAAELRDQLRKIVYITKPYEKAAAYLENPHLVADIRTEESRILRKALLPYYPQLKTLSRIECLDVAHTGGKSTTCSLVTFVDGEPEKNFYRRFRIKTVKKVDDYASLKEALSRRLNHLEDWGTPDLIVIDGGKGQVTTAVETLHLHSRGENISTPREWTLEIPVIGLAKRFEEIVIPLPNNKFKSLRLGYRNRGTQLLQRLRDEAHRFARSYHFKLRLKNLLPTK